MRRALATDRDAADRRPNERDAGDRRAAERRAVAGRFARRDRAVRVPAAVLALVAAIAMVPATDAGAQSAADRPPSEVNAGPIPAGRIAEAVDRVDGLMTDMMAKTGIPGAAVVVVHEGEVLFQKGYGIRKIGEAVPVDTDTVFQIASLSKSITGTVVAREVGEGRVDWSTPVMSLLPETALADPWVSAHVTIGDFLAHRSGLPDHAGDDLEDIGYGFEEIVPRLRLLPLAPFRATYAYTNMGFSLGAEAVARAAGTTWADLARDAIFEPLGMATASTRFADFMAHENRAAGHTLAGTEFRPLVQRDPDAQQPAGGVSTSIADFAKWMAMVLADGRGPDSDRIVAAGALLAAASPEMISSHPTTLTERTGAYGYGIGVGVSPTGRVVLSHSGAFSLGTGTTYQMMPSEDLGIAVFTNAAPLGGAEAVTAAFMDLVQFGEPTRDWVEAYGSLFAPMNAPKGALLGSLIPVEAGPASEPATYAGTYVSDYFGPATVSVGADGLVLAVGPGGVTTFELLPWEGDTFFFNVFNEDQPFGSVSKATFSRGAGGAIDTVTIEFLDDLGLGTFERE